MEELPEIRRAYSVRSVIVDMYGERRSISEWCRIFGISRQLVNYRLTRGWDLEMAIITPFKEYRKARKRVRNSGEEIIAEAIRSPDGWRRPKGKVQQADAG